jgi:hypothetical protein
MLLHMESFTFATMTWLTVFVTGAARRGAGTAYPCGTPEYTAGF